MASQIQYDVIYMKQALLVASLSTARRSKVGSLIVTHSGVVLSGYNGSPSGWDNNLEDEINGVLVTKPFVLHSELNTLLKAAKEGVSVLGSTIYISLSPCTQCAAMLAQAVITRVVYGEHYRDTTGIDLLKAQKIAVEFLNTSNPLYF